ncbi:MAG: hypothetical protein HFF36_02025 [Coprobacillus sp.]|nr:hypothetical protein [Coprobacillus sp.]MCI9092554.1 hypothetical protein [Coprobacillus sp.]
MGFFSKKQKVDYNAIFKEQYKSINQLTMQAQNELDYMIKESLYTLIIEKYDELIELIEKGASFDKEHFLSLRENIMKEYQMIQNINHE